MGKKWKQNCSINDILKLSSLGSETTEGSLTNKMHKWFISEGKNWFIPHHDTHKKAHLISWNALLIYALLFVLLQLSFTIFKYAKPGILGTSSSISVSKVIELTNIERRKLGLPPLSENQALNQAASAKAANMFEENYWAHFAPSGKDPWGFILSSGYKFSVAGENLAKNFSSPETVMAAWVASPTHRENIINSKYKDIGIAVEDGVLNGEQTTLVVQMFGTTSLAAAPSIPVQVAKVKITPTVSLENIGGKEIEVPAGEYTEPKMAVTVNSLPNPVNKPLVDPLNITKTVVVSLIGLITVLLMIDLIVLRRRGVFRLSSHHFAHMSILALAAAAVINSQPGDVGIDGITFKAPSNIYNTFEEVLQSSAADKYEGVENLPMKNQR